MTGPPAGRGELSLLDVLDRLLAGGVVIAGDLTLRIADVDLVRIDLHALLGSVGGTVPAPWEPCEPCDGPGRDGGAP
ncbi:gas vesicle protein [Streptomyces albireticuli]|nr:gas vesicle protein [Streptomyces albireticuli]MCD9143540.1 gas vesicle protein [Streptomyces albireticuli]MCD9164899.1 gas vesicle protein [Streptomyces albireticuli]MCD9191657.1 gas vesicle protein [Streptomyces albireticuli]